MKMMGDEEVADYGEEPGSPATRLFHTKKLDCYVIALMGFNIKVDVEVFSEKCSQFLPNIPRFSSLMVKEKHGKMTWVPTTINMEDHVLCPNLDYHDQENASLGDEKVDEYIASMSSKHMDIDKPLWEIHILNVKTSSANATTVFWIHHSLGDGITLISILLALTRKTSDPGSLPSIPTRSLPKTLKGGNTMSGRIKGVFNKIWVLLLVIFYTCCDVSLFLATVLFLKDTETPIKGGPGIEKTQKSVMHRDVSLHDLKLLKTATNSVLGSVAGVTVLWYQCNFEVPAEHIREHKIEVITINDAILGVTQAGLSRYLNRKYARHSNKDHKMKEKKNSLPKKMRIRAALIFNIRSSTGIQVLAEMMKKKSKAKWGNLIGYSFLPLSIALKNEPLSYITEAQAITKRKKLSLESRFTYAVVKFGCKFLGDKATSYLTHRLLSSTTILLSNLVGPREEVSFFEHPITFIAPSVHGLPFALLIHFQSYMNKMSIIFTYDPLVIPDPRQLFDDIEDSLQDIKNAAIRKGLIGKTTNGSKAE